jgi:hypothetical protein
VWLGCKREREKKTGFYNIHSRWCWVRLLNNSRFFSPIAPSRFSFSSRDNLNIPFQSIKIKHKQFWLLIDWVLRIEFRIGWNWETLRKKIFLILFNLANFKFFHNLFFKLLKNFTVNFHFFKFTQKNFPQCIPTMCKEASHKRGFKRSISRSHWMLEVINFHSNALAFWCIGLDDCSGRFK